MLKNVSGGVIYSGAWAKGLMHGIGRLVKDAGVYTGSMEDGVQSGEGVFQVPHWHYSSLATVTQHMHCHSCAQQFSGCHSSTVCIFGHIDIRCIIIQVNVMCVHLFVFVCPCVDYFWRMHESICVRMLVH